MNLPRDLTKLTAAQTKAVVAYFAKLPLAELRARQRLVDAQIPAAYALPSGEALANLQATQRHLDAAIDRKVFGKPAKRKKTCTK